jgi:hypothetical protein
MLVLLALSSLSAPVVDEYDGFHSAVSRAGDVNADGTPDFMVATRTKHDGSRSWFFQKEERVWILSGRDGAVLHTLRGRREGDCFGRSMDVAGDIDADGFDDVVIGACGQMSGVAPKLRCKGYVVVVSGRTGLALLELEGERSCNGFGFAVAGGGDVDGDGVPDIAVGAPIGKHEAAYVYSGRTGELVQELHGSVWDPEWDDYGLGTSVAILPDVDGDGCSEFIASDPSHPDPRGIVYADDEPSPAWGLVGIYSGPDGALLASLQMGADDRHGSHLGLGWTAGSAGDFDGDGTPDIFASAVNSLIRVYSGATFEVLVSIGGPWGYMHSEGASVDRAGDVDGDGRDDIVWGANETWDGIPCSDEGWASVSSASEDGGFFFQAKKKCEGIDVSGLGDVNGDGLADVVVAQRLGQVVRVLAGPKGEELYRVDLEALYDAAMLEAGER